MFIKNLIEKLLWILAPIFWGSFVWLMAWGPLGRFIPRFQISYQINFLIRTIIAGGFIILFLGKAFEYAKKHYVVAFFGYSIYFLPSWKFFLIITYIGILISFFFSPLWEYIVLHSIILGVLISSTIEEFLTHGFFVKCQMGIREFLIFNIVTSLSFSLMHIGYFQHGMPIFQNLMSGYFLFSFILGVITYRTRRIELPILIHMFSNFFNYTLPICIVQCQWQSFFVLLINILFILILIGCTYKLHKSHPASHKLL